VARTYPEGYAAKAGYQGGYFDPPIDFAAEARSAGAYGENVTDPDEIGPALQRGMKSVRDGTSAVISVWLPRLLQTDWRDGALHCGRISNEDMNVGKLERRCSQR
jgi:acetolactate synthase-1/2/3 large subunit